MYISQIKKIKSNIYLTSQLGILLFPHIHKYSDKFAGVVTLTEPILNKIIVNIKHSKLKTNNKKT